MKLIRMVVDILNKSLEGTINLLFGIFLAKRNGLSSFFSFRSYWSKQK